MKKRTMRKMGVILMVFGLFLVFGTAGSVDINAITFRQMLIQLAFAASMIATSSWLLHKCEK